LERTLRAIGTVAPADGGERAHEVWSLSGESAIANRTRQLAAGTEEQLLMVLGHESALTEPLIDELRALPERDVSVVVGTATEGLRRRVLESLPDENVFVSAIDWLTAPGGADDGTVVSRLVLVDRDRILVSSFRDDSTSRGSHHRAVFARGIENGVVVIARRLMTTGLLPIDDPDPVDVEGRQNGS